MATPSGVVDIKFKNEKQVLRVLRKFPKESNVEMKKVFREQGSEIQAREIRVTTRNLNRRTGALARGWTFRVLGNVSTGMELLIINETIYGPIHEHGDTITPKTKRFLAVPLPAAKTRAGVSISPGDLPSRQTFVASPRGTPIIFFKKSKDDKKPTPMFALKKSVEIPARLGAGGAFLAQRHKMGRAIEEGIMRVWARQKT
jgi:hypothetical protein